MRRGGLHATIASSVMRSAPPQSLMRRLDPEELATHLAAMYRLASSLTSSRHDADDLVQETLEHADAELPGVLAGGVEQP